jgi:hypothetical protein
LKLGVFWEVAFYCLARSNLKEFSPAKPGAYLFLLVSPWSQKVAHFLIKEVAIYGGKTRSR